VGVALPLGGLDLGADLRGGALRLRAPRPRPAA
jgi:hypothetical protein